MNRVPVWYEKGAAGVLQGTIVLPTDPIKLMLTTSAYVPDQTGDTFRSDVTNEVSGTGYTPGGEPLTGVAFSFDATLLVERVVWDSVLWPPPTSFTGRNAVAYVARGGASSADELLFYVAFPFDFIAGDAGLSLLLANPVLSLALAT